MWHFSLHASNIGPAYCQLQGLKVFGEADSQPHASVYVSVTLCLFSRSIWNALKWTQSLPEQRELWYPQYGAYRSEQLWKCQAGLR